MYIFDFIYAFMVYVNFLDPTIRKELPDILDFQEFMKYLQNFSKYKNATIFLVMLVNF